MAGIYSDCSTREIVLIASVRINATPVDGIDGDRSRSGTRCRVDDTTAAHVGGVIQFQFQFQFCDLTLALVADVQQMALRVDGQPAVDRFHCINTADKQVLRVQPPTSAVSK